MSRIVAALSFLIAIALLGTAVWIGGDREERATRPEAPDYRITRVAFVPRPEGALALVEEARGGEHALNVVDLADGRLIGGADFDGETDRRDGLRRVLGATARAVWLVSHDQGLHARDPATAEITATLNALCATNEALCPALRQDRETRYRFDLATGRPVVGVGESWHRIDPESLIAEAVPREALRLRSGGPQGYRAQRRAVELKGGTRIELAKIGRGRDARFDDIPTLVSGDGRRMRLADQLNLKAPLFLVDAVTDEPITAARPASVILVQNQGRVLSRLALAGREVWWKSLEDLIPHDAEAADWARIGGAHLDGERLVVHLGPRLVAVDVHRGERVWGYPE